MSESYTKYWNDNGIFIACVFISVWITYALKYIFCLYIQNKITIFLCIWYYPLFN